MAPRGRKPVSPLTESLARLRGPLASVGLFSAVVNVLALTGSLYMLQVYDRVLASRSVPTLVAISLLALGLFALQGLLEIVRAKVMSRVGSALERDLLQPVHDLLLRLPLTGRSAVEASQPVRDMEGVRNFMSGPGPMAFFDLPWMPLYLLVIYLLHPWLGVMATAGMLVLVAIALLTEHRLAGPTQEATQAAARRAHAAESARRNVEMLTAMGFAHRAAARFFTASTRLFAASERLSDTVSTLGALSRICRTILQSAILGLGAYLVLGNQMSPGAIIAASILAGRALAPVEAAIGHWRGFVAARQARRRLEDLLALLPAEPDRIALPERRQALDVEGIVVAAPGQRQPILRPASFSLKAGDGLAVMGPSGAGKSTLARALVGAWPLLAGAVRIDGAPLEQWPEAARSRLIGYLPQDVELFEGTVAENIARLDPEADHAAIVAAAEAAHVHELVLRLPEGYATMLGEGGHTLSVGQRQRIGLARALYGEPFLVVLDEPNAHLDEDGEKALTKAIGHIRARGGIAVIVSHRSGVLEAVNLVAVVVDGEVKAMGPRDAILAQIMNRSQAVPPPVRPVAAPEAPAAPFRTGMRLTGRMGGVARTDAPRPGPKSSTGGTSEG
ncbi:MAG: type I secretion system permease/ATPase [Beijerinckiaceae bacterium]|nr:type I secretion system permease/ATPase [Beijerinckiaceae bacterium]